MSMFRTLLMQIRKGFRNYIIKGASLVSGNDIKGVGDYDASTGKYNVPIVTGSRNVWDSATQMAQYGIPIQVDGSYYVERLRTLLNVKVFENTEGRSGQMYVSFARKGDNITQRGLRLVVVYTDGTHTTIGTESNTSDYSQYSAITSSGKVVQYIYWTYGNNGSNYIKDLIIAFSSVSLPYTPYINIAPRTYPLQISAPFYKVGTVADEADASTNTIIRRIGAVDLGSLSWRIDSRQRFQATIPNTPNKKPELSIDVPNALLIGYLTDSGANMYNHVNDKTVGFDTAGLVKIYDTSYTSLADFKTAMQGQYLYYELAEPTTESQAMPEIQGWQEGMTLMTDTEVQGEIVIN